MLSVMSADKLRAESDMKLHFANVIRKEDALLDRPGQST
jgi:hypothetical protein